MKKISLNMVVVMVLMTLFAGSAQSATILNLVDISGSLIDTKELFRKNMNALNLTIEETKTRDIFSVKCFRSHGNLWTLAEIKFPNRGGGRNKNVIRARNQLRLAITKGLKNPPVDFHKMGGSTDCIGAINQSLLWIRDQAATDKPVILNIYSDGLQTLGVGSLLHLKKVHPYQKRKAKLKDFLKHLERKMQSSHLISPARLDKVIWYGALYSEDLDLSTSDLASAESCLRSMWITFLNRELPETEVIYKLKY